MHSIQVVLEDSEFDALRKVKGSRSWKQLLMSTVRESDM